MEEIKTKKKRVRKPKINLRELSCQNITKYVGVGWGHIGRNKEKHEILTEEDKKKFKLDCAGLLIENAIDVGLYIDGFDQENYSRVPDGSSLVSHINKYCDLKNINDLKKSDVLVMQFNNNPTHLALFLGDHFNNGIDYFIHSSLKDRKVVIQRFDSVHRSYVSSVYSFKGIDN